MCFISPPQSRVQTIQDDCCSQNGVNVCTAGGAPDRCDAACALAFIPYYTECIEQVAGGSGGQSSAGDMRVFAELSEQCTAHLPAEETAILLSLVREKDENSLCTIDTDSILTLSEAKAGPPPCESDTSGLCEVFISSGTFTCDDTFCALCSQARKAMANAATLPPSPSR